MCRGLRGHHRHAGVAVGEAPQDVVFDAEIVGDDMKARLARRCVPRAERPSARRPFVGLRAADDLREIEPGHRRGAACARQRIGDVGVADRRRRAHAAVLCATLAQDPGELSGVDAGDADDVVGREVGAEIGGRAEIGNHARQIADDEPRRERLPRLDVFRVDADVADVRIGERDDLSRIRGIGEDLLISGHRRVEHDLTCRMSDGADRHAAKDRAVGERQYRGRAIAPDRQQRSHGRGGGGRRGHLGWHANGDSLGGTRPRGPDVRSGNACVTRSRSRFEAANYTGQERSRQPASTSVAQR